MTFPSRNLLYQINVLNQTNVIHFLLHCLGKGYASCQAGWFDEYQWLHYDISKNKVLCLICMKQDQPNNLKNAKNKEGAFI